jgi:hypothetical protein
VRRLALVLALAGIGCSRPAAAPAPAAAAAHATATVSRGWQSDSTGFVPDNSDAIEQGRRAAAAAAAAGEATAAAPTPIQLRAGADSKQLTPESFQALLADKGGRSRPISDVLSWAFPKKRGRTVQFVTGDGGQVEVPFAKLVADGAAYQVKLNRRDQLRVQIPDGAVAQGGDSDRGHRGDGVRRQRQRVIAEIRLQ